MMPAAEAPSDIEAAVGAVERHALTLLKSGDECKEAWGAWYAASHRLRNVAVAVRDQMNERLLDAKEPPDAQWLSAQIDALIQTRTPARAETMQWLAERKMHRWVVLLAELNCGESLTELKQAALATDYPEFIAAANLFARCDSATFAKWALEATPLTLKVHLKDDGPEFGGGHSLKIKRRPQVAPRPKWPPEVTYCLLSEEFVTGAVVFAPGPVPVTYLRTLGAEEVKQAFNKSSISSGSYLVAVLRSFTRLPDYSGSRWADSSISLRWRPEYSVDNYCRDVNDAADDIRIDWEILREELARLKVIPDGACLPKLTVLVNDARTVKTTLPVLKYDLNTKTAIAADGSAESINAEILRSIKADLQAVFKEHLKEQQLKADLKKAGGEYIEPLQPRPEYARIFTQDAQEHHKQLQEIDFLIRNRALPEDSWFAGLIDWQRQQIKEIEESDPGIQRLMADQLNWHRAAISFFERLRRQKKVSRRELNFLLP
jgi:hypothetical protein